MSQTPANKYGWNVEIVRGAAISRAPTTRLGSSTNANGDPRTDVAPATSARPINGSNGRTPASSQRNAPWSKNRELGTDIQPNVSTPSITTSHPWADDGDAHPYRERSHHPQQRALPEVQRQVEDLPEQEDVDPDGDR